MKLISPKTAITPQKTMNAMKITRKITSVQLLFLSGPLNDGSCVNASPDQ